MEKENGNAGLKLSGLAGIGCMAYNDTIHMLTGWGAGNILLFGSGTAVMCGYLIYKDFRDKNNKWNKLFRNCKLKNAEEQLPKLIDTKNRNNGTEYIFTIPLGLSEEDFEKKKAAIECFLKNNIVISRKNSTVSITALNND